jgi:hypothetical protein
MDNFTTLSRNILPLWQRKSRYYSKIVSYNPSEYFITNFETETKLSEIVSYLVYPVFDSVKLDFREFARFL